ncbi:hypothetical protein JXQ70_03935 [bacterium]|nr:hypothetical protein [bacterium]
MLKKGLVSIIENVEGSLGAVLLGLDGLPIVEVNKKEGLDISILGAELTGLFKNSIKFCQDMKFGAMHEVIMVTDAAVILCRAITDEYFLLLAVSPDSLFGKGRYQLKKSVETFRKQLI